MAELNDGETVEFQGSSGTLYFLNRTGSVYSCSCPAWLHQALPIHLRTCKHLKQFRGDTTESARIANSTAARSPLPQTNPTPNAGPTTSSKQVPALLLAHVWDNAANLKGWWISEKLDGVRAYWDGQQFISRQGNRFVAPDWFIEGLPAHPMDGEIWGGRQRFQQTVGVVRRLDGGDAWKELRYMVFDLPALGIPFEDRMARLQQLFAERYIPYAQAHQQETCRDMEHLRGELERVTQEGGEGLMLRKPGSLYENGRSFTLLKAKKFFDAEAYVMGHQEGTGKHMNRLGALLVSLPDGTAFAIGTGFSDAERENPPPIGSWVSFRYQELTDAGVPRFPSYIGLRDDLTPEQISRPLPRPAPPPVSARPTTFQPPPPRPPPTPYQPRLLEAEGENWRLRLTYNIGSITQFWEIGIWDNHLTEVYGREGRDPHSRTWTASSPEEAIKEGDKLAQAKIEKGYTKPQAS